MTRRVICANCKTALTVQNNTVECTCSKCKTVLTIKPPEARVATKMDTAGKAGAALFQIGCGIWAVLFGALLLLCCLIAIWNAVVH